MRIYPLKNLMMIAVFYQLLLFIGYPILLDRLILRDEALDLSGEDEKSFGSRADSYFILYDGHEC